MLLSGSVTRNVATPPVRPPSIKTLQVPPDEALHFAEVHLPRFRVVRELVPRSFVSGSLHPLDGLVQRLVALRALDLRHVSAKELVGVREEIDRQVLRRDHKRPRVVWINSEIKLVAQLRKYFGTIFSVVAVSPQ